MRYFKRLSEGTEENIATSKVINLSDVFGKEDETDKFVTRYLQTTHCDLFFADAAILVEGSAELMLLPHFIRNKYHGLYQRYISILSISGRHSHRLGPLIDKLCLPTLVIADIDSALKDGHHKAARPKRRQELISSNYTITKWLLKENDLDKLLDLPEAQKVIPRETPYRYSIRVAYQTPIMINYAGEEKEAIANTFEDCLVYTNYQTFKDLSTDDTGSLIKNVNDTVECAQKLADLLRGMNCHVNLIPVNYVPERGFDRTPVEHIEQFEKTLKKRGINATVRRELGSDIDAACGQLRAKEGAL